MGLASVEKHSGLIDKSGVGMGDSAGVGDIVGMGDVVGVGDGVVAVVVVGLGAAVELPPQAAIKNAVAMETTPNIQNRFLVTDCLSVQTNLGVL